MVSFGTYTKLPPDHTAPCRAANLWSVGGISVMNFSRMSGSHCGSCSASSMPEYTMPMREAVSCMLW